MTNRWLPIAGGILMNLALGSLYAWSVFVLPLEKEFGWTRAQTSWVFTIAIVCFALSFIVAGRIQDLKGPRICAAIGGILVSAGFILASFTSSLIGLYLSFGVVVGLGNGFGYATPTPVGSKWFPDKRGLVIGLMVGGYGAGSAILGSLATEDGGEHGLATDVSAARRHLLRHDDGGHRAAEKSTARLSAPNWRRRPRRWPAATSRRARCLRRARSTACGSRSVSGRPPA